MATVSATGTDRATFRISRTVSVSWGDHGGAMTFLGKGRTSSAMQAGITLNRELEKVRMTSVQGEYFSFFLSVLNKLDC